VRRNADIMYVRLINVKEMFAAWLNHISTQNTVHDNEN